MVRQTSAEIARAFACADGRLDRTLDRVCHFRVTQVSNHHRCAQNRPDRVDDATAGDVGRGPMHGLEQAPFRLGVDVAGGCDAHPADQLRGQVGQDVAEEVAGDDDVELRRVAHQLHRGRVHIEVTGLDVGTLLATAFHCCCQSAPACVIALDLSTITTSRWAAPNAYSMIRVTPKYVLRSSWIATSSSVPFLKRPPMPT